MCSDQTCANAKKWKKGKGKFNRNCFGQFSFSHSAMERSQGKVLGGNPIIIFFSPAWPVLALECCIDIYVAEHPLHKRLVSLFFCFGITNAANQRRRDRDARRSFLLVVLPLSSDSGSSSAEKNKSGSGFFLSIAASGQCLSPKKTGSGENAFKFWGGASAGSLASSGWLRPVSINDADEYWDV